MFVRIGAKSRVEVNCMFQKSEHKQSDLIHSLASLEELQNALNLKKLHQEEKSFVQINYWMMN